ncbi:MAG: SBBP repeat-containing protein [Nitrospirae bacterium]|nr:SBBP repeat-containing protein [Nitrospirota bacterium]
MIQKFSGGGAFEASWSGLGSGGGSLQYPTSIAVDSSGYVYVTDMGLSIVAKFNSSGTFITKWGSAGTGNGKFQYPSGVAVDKSGNVYVVDVNNQTLQKFTSTGIFVKNIGSTGTGNGQFSDPIGVAVDSLGAVYVADYGNGRVLKFASDGTFVTTFGGSGSGSGQMTGPVAVVVDSSGNVYVSDRDAERISKFTPVTVSSTYNLTVTTSGTGSGTVTASSGTISWSGSTGTAAYTSGTSVTLTATANSGSSFSSWSGCDSKYSNQCTVAMNANKSVTVAFTTAVSDYQLAGDWISAIYNKYWSSIWTTGSPVFSSVLEVSGTSGTYYMQFYSNGTVVEATPDGSMSYYYNGRWFYFPESWKTSDDLAKATAMTYFIYNAYASYFGEPLGDIIMATDTSSGDTYYVQFYSTGTGLLAGADGKMYYYPVNGAGWTNMMGYTWK